MNKTEKNKEKKLFDMLNDFSVCMLCITNAENPYYVRPMAIGQIDEHQQIWFISRKDSNQVGIIKESTKALIVAQNGFTSSITLNGEAVEVNDRNKLEEIWNSNYEVWFEDGKKDKQATLIKFVPVSGEYWDNRGIQKAKYLFEMTKAKITGNKIDLDNEEVNARVQV